MADDEKEAIKIAGSNYFCMDPTPCCRNTGPCRASRQSSSQIHIEHYRLLMFETYVSAVTTVQSPSSERGSGAMGLTGTRGMCRSARHGPWLHVATLLSRRCQTAWTTRRTSASVVRLAAARARPCPSNVSAGAAGLKIASALPSRTTSRSAVSTSSTSISGARPL